MGLSGAAPAAGCRRVAPGCAGGDINSSSGSNTTAEGRTWDASRSSSDCDGRGSRRGSCEAPTCWFRNPAPAVGVTAGDPDSPGSLAGSNRTAPAARACLAASLAASHGAPRRHPRRPSALLAAVLVLALASPLLLALPAPMATAAMIAPANPEVVMDSGGDMCDIQPTHNTPSYGLGPPVANGQPAYFRVIVKMRSPMMPITATLAYGDEGDRRRSYRVVSYSSTPDAYGRTSYVLDRAVGTLLGDSTPEASTARLYTAPGHFNVSCVAQDATVARATGSILLYVYSAAPHSATGGALSLLTGNGSGTDAADPGSNNINNLPVSYVDPDLPGATFHVEDLIISNSASAVQFPYESVPCYLTVRKLVPDDADPEEEASWVLRDTVLATLLRQPSPSPPTRWAVLPSPLSHKFRSPGRYRLAWEVPDVEYPESNRPYAATPNLRAPTATANAGPVGNGNDYIEVLAVASKAGYIEPPMLPPPELPSPPPQSPRAVRGEQEFPPPAEEDAGDRPPPPSPSPSASPDPDPTAPLEPTRLRPPSPPLVPEEDDGDDDDGGPSEEAAEPPSPPTTKIRMPPPGRKRPPPKARRNPPPRGGSRAAGVDVHVAVQVSVHFGRRTQLVQQEQQEQ